MALSKLPNEKDPIAIRQSIQRLNKRLDANASPTWATISITGGVSFGSNANIDNNLTVSGVATISSLVASTATISQAAFSQISASVASISDFAFTSATGSTMAFTSSYVSSLVAISATISGLAVTSGDVSAGWSVLSNLSVATISASGRISGGNGAFTTISTGDGHFTGQVGIGTNTSFAELLQIGAPGPPHSVRIVGGNNWNLTSDSVGDFYFQNMDTTNIPLKLYATGAISAKAASFTSANFSGGINVISNLHVAAISATGTISGDSGVFTTISTGAGSFTSIDVSTIAATTIIIAENGTIGQAAGPLLTFNDSNNIFTIAGARVVQNTTLTLTNTFGYSATAIVDQPGTIAWAGGLRVVARHGSAFPITNNLTALQLVAEQNGAGLVSLMRGATFNVFNTSTGGVTNARILEVNSPFFTSTGTITNLYGLYIAAQAHAKVTTPYSIYQVGASDTNYLEGITGIGIAVPTAKVHIDQSSASGAMPVLKLDQGDIDDSFIDFIGTSAADGTRSISSDTTEDSTKFGAIRIEINGTTKWIRVYDDES